MLVMLNGLIGNLLLPQRNVFGFCDNFKSPLFLHEIHSGSCVQQINSLYEMVDTYLNPTFYTN